MSDCPACPRYVPHDLARCRFVQGSKWTEDDAKDVVQSPRTEPRRRPNPSPGSRTWPSGFDVTPLPAKGDKVPSSSGPERRESVIRKAIKDTGFYLMSKIKILKRPASASRNLPPQAPKATRWKSLKQRQNEYAAARLRILGSTGSETCSIRRVDETFITTPS